MATIQTLSSLVKATEVLKCVLAGVYRISDISRKSGYDKSAVFRILNTFEQQGFVTKDLKGRQYFPGPFLRELSINPAFTHQALINIARNEMEKLCNKLEETISLLIPLGTARHILHVVHADNRIIYYPRVGNLGPLHAGAAGKVLLSQYRDEELKSYLDITDLIPITDTTTTNKEELLEQINIVRKQGYMISYGEVVESSIAIAVPIKHYSCPVALAMAGSEVLVRGKIEVISESLRKGGKVIEAAVKEMNQGG